MIKLLLSLIMFSTLCLASESTKIDMVKIEGAPPDQVEALKTASGFLPGDELEQARIDRALEKLKEFYENKGYPQVTVRHEIIREKRLIKVGEYKEAYVLDFKFNLGEPIRISAVGFTAKEGVLPPDVLPKLFLIVDLKPGEPFDRDRIKEMRRGIETTLTNFNYVDSRVVEITTDNPKPGEKVQGGLKVNFTIELGQQVLFSVYGSSFFARSELMLMIEEQRAMGLGRDYVNVILNRLKEKYIDYGFRKIEITPYTFEPKNNQTRKVVYEINEGKRTHIKNIFFDGNEAFSANQLEGIFLRNAADRVIARIYNEKMVEEAARATVEELKKHGFLSAKLIAIKLEEIPLSTDINLRLFITEGLQTKIQTIDILGNRNIAYDKLIQYLGLHEGDPLNLVQLEDGLDRMKREYRNLGYLNVKVNSEKNNQVVTYSEKNQFAYLNFDFDEGPQFHFTGLEIFGNEKTKNVVIEREFQLKVGESVFENKLFESEERLRRLGIFSQVNLELVDDPKESLGKSAKVSVQEAIPGNEGVGIGYRNDLGVRLFGELSYANLWGMNHTWAFNVSGNRRITGFRFNEYSAQMSYIWPWVFWGETTMRPSITVDKTQYIQFDAETYAIATSFERSLYKPFHLTGSLTYTLEKIRQFDAVDARQNQEVRVGSITPLLRFDFRDNPLTPRHGFYAFSSFEYADSFLGSQVAPTQVSYGRLQVRTDYYADFIPHVVWYNSVRGGWLKNFADIHNADGTINPNVAVPLIKQFALGGVSSLRGFGEQEYNVQTLSIQDYLTYVNYRTQIDFFPSQNLSFGPFLDAANLRVNSFSFGALRYGSGVGMHYLTPIGPVNFDWGFKLFPRPGEETNMFYFSLGVI